MSGSPLHEWKSAVVRKDVDAVTELFEQHPHLEDRVNDLVFSFNSPAIFQCRDTPDLVDVLIEHGADINLKTGWWAGGFGILEDVDPTVATDLIARGAVADIWAAVGLNMHGRVIELLDANPRLITARGGDGKHPLHYAQDPAMVDLLVERGADVNARDIDHESTPIQYLVSNEPVVRRLLDHGAVADVFVAAALGDADLVQACIDADRNCCDSRLGIGAWTNTAGGHIFNWTLGHDATPLAVARDRKKRAALNILLAHSTAATRLGHYIWYGDANDAILLASSQPESVDQLLAKDPAMMSRAAWWYRPEAVRLMLEIGFDPHVAGDQDSTPLDRAAFHGYADIIELLLEFDANPPIAVENEFGGTPLGACIHGAVHGWITGHPQDHVRSSRLLLAAGSDVSVDWIPTGNDEIDEVLAKHLRSL